MDEQSKVITAHVWNPHRTNLFKTKANDRAELHYIKCSNSENCSLYAKGQCICNHFLGGRCTYGRKYIEHGPTKRSKNCSSWCQDKQEEHKDIMHKITEAPPSKMAYIGDYVYLPYAHFTMNESVPFLGHSHLFTSGTPFLKREDWNLENIKKIVSFHPYSLMGGEITSYQRDEIPKFLLHLSEVDSEMYNKFIEQNPTYRIETKNYVGRKALLKTVNFPITFKTDGSRDGQYRVEWTWDGIKLKTSSENAYNSTWGDFKRSHAEELIITLVPNDNAEIKIQDNAWVNSNTKFVD